MLPEIPPPNSNRMPDGTSVGAGGGLSLPIIGRLLGHTQPRTTQRYAHLADDPLREAAKKITTVITGAGKTATVAPLFGRRS